MKAELQAALDEVAIKDPDLRLTLAVERVARMTHAEFLDAAQQAGLQVHNTSST